MIGSINCKKCGQGKYQGNEGQASCESCLAGYYASDSGSSSCKDCNGNRYSRSGSATCNLCLRSYYYSIDGLCVSCPKGAVCSADGDADQRKLTIDRHYWRVSSASVDLYECPLTGACKGGANFSEYGDGYCNDGYVGPMCAVCSAGRYLNSESNSCAVCDGNFSLKRLSNSPVLCICIASFGMAALSFLFHSLANKKAEKRQQTFRQFMRGFGELSPRSKVINDETRRSAEFAINALNPELLSESPDGNIEWHTNADGSTTCIVVKQLNDEAKEKTSTNTSTSAIATISVTTTSASEEATSTISHRIVVRPSSCVSSISGIVKKAMVKVKALTSFGQGDTHLLPFPILYILI